MVKENETCFSQVTWVFEEDWVGHWTDEVVEAMIASFDDSISQQTCIAAHRVASGITSRVATAKQSAQQATIADAAAIAATVITMVQIAVYSSVMATCLHNSGIEVSRVDCSTGFCGASRCTSFNSGGSDRKRNRSQHAAYQCLHKSCFQCHPHTPFSGAPSRPTNSLSIMCAIGLT